MAWDEWEQLKTAAVERQSAQMQINHAAPDGGGGGGEGGTQVLQSDKPTWTKAAEGVSSLRENIAKALTQLETGQSGLGKESGCLTAAAQRDVHDSWERYVKKVSDRCRDLAEVMEKAGGDLLKTEEAIGAEIAGLKTRYEDTPAIGGQAKGR